MVFGIVGKVGSGKTSFLEIAARGGYPIFNSDAEVREFYGQKEIVEKIQELLSLKKEEDFKERLIESIKKDPNVLSKLEEVFHPLIEKKIVEFIEKQSEGLVFLEVPLLYESKFDKYCDKVILVESEEKERLERLRAHKDLQLVEILDARQEDASLKKLKADIVIYNTKDKNFLLKQFKKVIKLSNL